MKKIKNYRSELFVHLDGAVLIPTLKGLINTNLLYKMIRQESFTIKSLESEIFFNEGYLNVALRLLRSKNLIEYNFIDNERSSIYTINDNLLNIYDIKEKIVAATIALPFYSNFIKSCNNNEKYEKALIENFNFLNKNESNVSNEIFKYFEGIIIGPLLTNLSFYNFLNYANGKFTINDLDKNLVEIIKKIFISSKFLEFNHNKYKVSDKGSFFLKKSSSYGVTISYLPLFNKIEDLLIGKCDFIWARDKNNHEIHVNRQMNVWGSGGAHKTYFKKIDTIIENIFNKDIKLQPKGIIDVACGDGTFLKHIYNVITQRTKRKHFLKTHPLLIIGTDINKAARSVSRYKLDKSKINNIIINGNIGSPDSINKTIKKNYGYNLNDFLNTRTFLDHNRIYKKPKKILYKNIVTSGSFAYKGKIVQKNDLINNLIQHLKDWSPYIKKYGLILLELHTISPDITKTRLGKTLSCAYDTTHGFSDQYLVEHKVFIECLNKANLSISEKFLELYPNSSNPTVSINYIK